MNNRTGILRENGTTVNGARLAVITAVMSAGGLAGSIYAIKAASDEYFTLSGMCGTELFKWLVIINLAPVVAAFLSSYFGYGAVISVASAFCRGFVFAMPLTYSIRQNGLDGYYGAFSLCGILSVFAVIIMSMHAIEVSAMRRGGTYRGKALDEHAKNIFLLMVCCAAAIVFGGAMDAFLLK